MLTAPVMQSVLVPSIDSTRITKRNICRFFADGQTLHEARLFFRVDRKNTDEKYETKFLNIVKKLIESGRLHDNKGVITDRGYTPRKIVLKGKS